MTSDQLAEPPALGEATVRELREAPETLKKTA